MRAIVDTGSCTGCGLCASLCPDAFDIGELGKAVPRHKLVPQRFEQDYQYAAESCPEDAIRLFTKATGSGKT
jgi:ferredoxin